MAEKNGDEFLIMALEQLVKGQDQLVKNHETVISRLDHLDECLDDGKQRFKEFEIRTDVRFTQLEKNLLSIVPNGDFEGHRLYHIERIKVHTQWEKIRASVFGKVLEWAVIGSLGWLLISLFGVFKTSLHG